MRHTVLIVDDHPGFRAAARALLELDGYTVVGEADDVASGLRESRRLRPAIVLLDVGLPDASGIDLAAQLTAQPDPPAVVLVSSRDRADLASSPSSTCRPPPMHTGACWRCSSTSSHRPRHGDADTW